MPISALDPDYELAVKALTPLLDCESESFIGGLAAGFLIEQVQVACATARALGRAEARGAATAPSGTPPPPDPTTPATDARERVAEALWRAWWRTHGESESETEIQFPQLYESARNRWLEIADAGIRAMEKPR